MGWNNATDALDSSKWQYQNLTALDCNGSYRWSYHANNGTLQIWAVYSDGVIIANHYNFKNFNQTLNWYEDWIDEIIAISPDGQVIWHQDLVLSGKGSVYSCPCIASNGTFIIYTENNVSYQIGYDRENGLSYVAPVERVPSVTSNGPEDLYYEVRKEYVSWNVTTNSMYALYPENGSTVWKTVLDYSDEPYFYPVGWESRAAIADGMGMLYANDLDDNHLFALSSDGRILWERPYTGHIVSGYSDGGNLLRTIHL